jgi:hypothetical protein
MGADRWKVFTQFNYNINLLMDLLILLFPLFNGGFAKQGVPLRVRSRQPGLYANEPVELPAKCVEPFRRTRLGSRLARDRARASPPGAPGPGPQTVEPDSDLTVAALLCHCHHCRQVRRTDSTRTRAMFARTALEPSLPSGSCLSFLSSSSCRRSGWRSTGATQT